MASGPLDATNPSCVVLPYEEETLIRRNTENAIALSILHLVYTVQSMRARRGRNRAAGGENKK